MGRGAVSLRPGLETRDEIGAGRVAVARRKGGGEAAFVLSESQGIGANFRQPALVAQVALDAGAQSHGGVAAMAAVDFGEDLAVMLQVCAGFDLVRAAFKLLRARRG